MYSWHIIKQILNQWLRMTSTKCFSAAYFLVGHSCKARHVPDVSCQYCHHVSCHQPQVSLSLDSSLSSPVSRERLIYISKLNWSHNHFLSCGKIGFDECLNVIYSIFSSGCQVRRPVTHQPQMKWRSESNAFHINNNHNQSRVNFVSKTNSLNSCNYLPMLLTLNI